MIRYSPKKRYFKINIPSDTLFFILSFSYIILFGTLSILKYFSLHSTFFDLGIFENVVWRIAFNGDYYLISFGHFQPILLFYSLAYKIFPSPITLLLLQTITIGIGSYPLYKISKKYLKGNLPLLVILAYFLYPGVEYGNLFDFHTDHLFMTLMLFGFYFLEENKIKGLIIVSILCLFIKEPLILSLFMFGFYIVIKRRYYKSGIFIIILSAVVFISATYLFIPYFTKGTSYYNIAFSKLGTSIPDILKNIILNPKLLITEFFSDWKKQLFIFSIFAPVMFIALLSPLELLPVLPVTFIGIITQIPNYYMVRSHYFASIVPGLFIAFIYGLKKLQKVKKLPFYLIIWIIVINMILSPSPISLTFWSKTNFSYSRNAYIITKRDKMIKEALRKYIPSDAEVVVSTQNSLNYSLLAQRRWYLPFPEAMERADFVVIDLKKPLTVGDKVDEQKFTKLFKEIIKTRDIIFRDDEFYIFGKKKVVM